MGLLFAGEIAQKQAAGTPLAQKLAEYGPAHEVLAVVIHENQLRQYFLTPGESL